MKRNALGAAAAIAALGAPHAALAASDYLLQLDDVKGAHAAAIEIDSWSWGATNSGASSAPRGGLRVAAGDVNGDGRADLAVVSKLPEVSNFVLRVPASSPLAHHYCAVGSQLPTARITKAGAGVLVLSGTTVRSCAAGPRQTVSMTLTGQMRHTKTGHVTLLK
jgi:hypothetical protein